jgi:hypothetical protein
MANVAEPQKRTRRSAKQIKFDKTQALVRITLRNAKGIFGVNTISYSVSHLICFFTLNLDLLVLYISKNMQNLKHYRQIVFHQYIKSSKQ